MIPAGSDRPIEVVVFDDLVRSRVTVLFRLVLALPHVVWALLWTAAVLPAGFVMWAAVVVEGRAPRVLHEFLAAYLRYASHLSAYLSLAADPYPGFTGEPGYPVDVEIAPPARQTRRGAAFRVVLAVPAILLSSALGRGVAGGWSSGLYAVGGGGVLGVTAVLTWFAALARGTAPRGLRDLSVYVIGYSAQTMGYLLLLTDRYPSADPALVDPPAELPSHVVTTEVRDGLERSRLMVAFRALLVLPHLVWLTLWSVLAFLAVVAAWFVALAIGRVPWLVHRFLAAYVRYASHVSSFLFLVGGPFPGFVGAEGYPIDVRLEAPRPQRRWRILTRGVIAIPAMLVSGAYGTALVVVGLLAWWASLVTGRMPAGLRDLGVAAVRYSAQSNAYLLLLTDRYPYAAPALRDRPRDVQLTIDGLP